MEEKKIKLIEEKEKIEDKIKKLNGRLKTVNQELENILLQEKLKSTDEIIGLLKEKGIEDVSQFIDLIKAGKVNINSYENN